MHDAPRDYKLIGSDVIQMYIPVGKTPLRSCTVLKYNCCSFAQEEQKELKKVKAEMVLTSLHRVDRKGYCASRIFF